MQPESPSACERQIAVFYQRHRTGLVTLVFTDLVDSTALMRQLGDQAGTTFLQQRRQIVRQTLKEFPDGEEIETAGDSFLLIFAKPSDGVRFALLVQAHFRAFRHEKQVGLLERIGIHLGEVVIKEHETESKAKDLYGIQIGACARVMSLAQGGQVLMTRGVFDSARQVLKGEDIPGVGRLSWVSHGPYQLKGIEEPVEICEVGEVGQSPLSAPKTGEKAERYVTPGSEPVLGWRPAIGQEVPNTKWVLEQKLGEGGFGEVWLGRHQTMKERRVFKFCFRADRVRSLKREMTLFRVLKERVGDHPNIVRLLEVYFDEPPFYVVMDHVEGQDLKTWSEERGGVASVPLATRLEIIAQIADALQAAHDAGVIHRDVKPGNILVGDQRSEVRRQPEASESSLATCHSSLVAKLTDFGIGQVASDEVLRGVTKAGFTQTIVADSSSSQTGSQMYMAPELLAGKPASIRSDIYSLGVVLYQLLVGDLTRPLTTDWAEGVSDALLREDLKHCFAGSPQDRFAGAGQLATQLRALPERRAALEQQKAALAARERAERRAAQRQRVAVLAGGAAVVLLLLAITLGYGSQRAEKQRRRAEAYLYDADMNLAGQALQQNNIGRALSFLNIHRPAKTGQRDLRGWEWRYLWEKCRSDELATLGEHEGRVQSVAVSPDGQWVASGGFDGLLKIWALASGAAGGRSVTNLLLGGGQVSSVAFSPDGRWLAAGTWYNGFALLRAPGWQREMTVTNTVTGSVAFSADSRLLAVGGEVWSLDTRTRLRTLPYRVNVWGEHTVAWLPNSQTLAGFNPSIGRDRVSLFDIHSPNPDAVVAVKSLRDEQGMEPLPKTLAFSPDGKHLAVGCVDATIRIYAASDWRQVKLLTNHTAWVSSLAFSKDGLWLATASADHSVRVWRTRDWEETAILRGHQDELWAVAFTPDGKRLVTGSKDHSVRLWPLAARSRPVEEVSVYDEDTKLFRLSALCPFRLGPSNILTIWDGQTLKVRQRLSSYPVTNVVNCRLSSDGRLLLMATAEGGLWLTDLAPGAVSPPVCLQTNGPPFGEAAFSEKATLLAVADRDALRVWNLKHQPRRPGFALATGYARRLRFSQDERLLVAATGPIQLEPTVLVWEVASGKEMLRFQFHHEGIGVVDFSPNGTVLAIPIGNNTCKLFDLRRRQPSGIPEEIATLRGQMFSFNSVSFSPDGRRLAGAMADGSINIWDMETGREVLVLKQQQGGGTAFAVCFHPSGDSLISGDGRTLLLRHAPSWAEIAAAEKKTEGKPQ